MENTLERMVDRIYQEGISRAEDRAREIMTAAEKRAEEIKRYAQQEAEEIIRQAREAAEKKLRTVQSDLALLATRALSQLKSEISTLLSAKTVANPVAALSSDSAFISEVVLRLLAASPDGTISLTVPEEMRTQITAELSTRLGQNLAGLEIRGGSQKAGFTVMRKDAGYELDFTEAALLEFLQPYMKPALASLFRERNG